ncbi:hypothetical protein, partial [Methylibium sp.]|uniref:hypothetical protein n=1 Tax=Methylibium sp. TaxID=2067992 RepID=UPI0025EA1A2C
MWTRANPPDQSTRRRYSWRASECLRLRIVDVGVDGSATWGEVVWSHEGKPIGYLLWAYRRDERGGALVIDAQEMGFPAVYRIALVHTRVAS